MAETHNQPHDQVCAEATGHTCICACRGRMHGIGAKHNRGLKLARMGEVTTTAKRTGGKVDTPAERRHNPVTVTRTPAPGAAVDAHGVVEGTRPARLRDEQTARIHASKADPQAAMVAAKRDAAAAAIAKNAVVPHSAPVPPNHSPAHASTQVPAPSGPSVSSNEPLWMHKRTGAPVAAPRALDIKAGVVVRDKRREDIRAAQNAAPGQAVEVDMFGVSTVMGGAQSSNDTKPKPKADTAPQTAMFATDERELAGQGSLVPAILDRPADPQVQHTDLSRPAVPADLSGVDDNRLAELIAGTEDPHEVQRLGDEFDRRANAEAYQHLVASVPDEAGLRRLDEAQVADLYVQLTAVAHDPDPAALHRLETELDRRTQAEALGREKPLRDFIDQAITSGSEADLEVAARHAATLNDENAIERVFGEWDRREKAQQARLDAEHAAKVKADAERLAAEQQAVREHAAQVAREQADAEQLAAEFRGMSQSDVAGEFVRNAASMDPARQRRHAAAVVELDHRAQVKKQEDARAKAAESRRRWTSAPVRDLTDAELRDSIADHEADGYNSNTVRLRRLDEMKTEQAGRKQEADRLAALKAATPTAPWRSRNPIGAVGDLDRWAEHDQAMRARLVRARMAALGVPEPAVDPKFGPDMGYRAKQQAIKKAIAEAEKTDPRSAQEQAAMVLAHYRHQAQIDGVDPNGQYGRHYYGPDDDPTAPPLRAAAPYEAIPKSWDVWQEMRRQAIADQQAGQLGTAARYELASKRALGLPDDATSDEIRSAYGADRRSSGQLASQMIVEFREIAKEHRIDPGDRLRYGPPEKKPRAEVSPGYRGASTPEQQKQLDDLLAGGADWIDAYAQVHGLDPDVMRQEEAGYAAGGGTIKGSAQRAIRKSYEEHVHLQYLDAETATAGHLLSKKGIAAGIDASALFSGPLSKARAHASEELLRYWVDHPRMTYAEFKANVSGGAKAARQKSQAESNGRNFV